MNLAMLLEMAADGLEDRIAVGSRHGGGMSYRQLLDGAAAAAGFFSGRDADRVALVDLNSDAVPLVLFGAALASKPYVPLNYRLTDQQLRAVLSRTAPAVAVVEESVVGRLTGPESGGDVPGVEVVLREALLGAAAAGHAFEAGFTDPDDVAVLLFTSGTTGEPKAAVLRHRHLTTYVITTVEFMGSDEDEAALVSVPPYHIAGISAVLSSVYSGRRLVYLPQFTAEEWVATARREAITHAMVVPTMLGRILDVVAADGQGLPSLRHLSYGGGRMPVPVIEQAIALLPGVSFVNAYGLTETSSTIAVLGPEDHVAAFSSDDPAVRARLGSVGRPLPTLEVEIRREDGAAVSPGERGEIYVRGEQVSGEYEGKGSVTTADGWFPTNDGGYLDAEGYLFLEGRLDDVIVRGAENLSPGEIEDVLVSHAAVADAAVLGVPDDEWGEAVAAVVVLHDGASVTVEDLQQWVRERLRSTRMPTRVEFRTELPYNETGKLLRRVLRAELCA